MKVYLSHKKQSDESFRHCSNLATFESSACDGEITSLTVDCFLSSFSFGELQAAMAEILKKCRINCEVTILEPDFNLLSRSYSRGDNDLEFVNTLIFEEGAKKSLINMPILESLIPSNFEVSEKFISNSLYCIVKLRRVK